MKQMIQILTAILKCEINQEILPDELAEKLTPEVCKCLYEITQKHDLAHIVAHALQRIGKLQDYSSADQFKKALYVALVRYEKMRCELDKIYTLFDSELLIYVPLKGALMRQYYPEPWMRTSCDIDILVHEEDLERAELLLTEKLRYTLESRNYHDVSFYSPSGVHLELHFQILEHNDNLDCILQQVWDYVEKSQDYQYHMTNTYFMFHLWAHTAYHFMGGGCGIRSLLDLWILEKQMTYDKEQFWNMCRQSKIDIFVMQMERLIRVWFDREPGDSVTDALEEYLISGGTYGSPESVAKARKAVQSNLIVYIWQRLFMSYKDLCVLFPKLKSWAILYPYYMIRRWCRLLQGQVFKRVSREVSIYRTVEKEDIKDMKKLFERLGL